MWTATIKSVENLGHSAKVIVTFVNGARTLDHTFGISAPNTLEKMVNDYRAQLEFIDSFVATTLPDTIIAPIVPSQDDIDKLAYQEDIKKFNSLKRQIDAEIILPSNAEYLTLKAKIKTNYKAEYIDLI